MKKPQMRINLIDELDVVNDKFEKESNIFGLYCYHHYYSL